MARQCRHRLFVGRSKGWRYFIWLLQKHGSWNVLLPASQGVYLLLCSTIIMPTLRALTWQRCAVQKTKQLTATDGHILLLEYAEEHPLLLSRPGTLVQSHACRYVSFGCVLLTWEAERLAVKLIAD